MRRHALLLALVLLAFAPAAAGAGAPTVTIHTASNAKNGLKLAVSPGSGELPLTVTFTLTAPKATAWRLDFGDGRSQSAKGTPPARVTHIYRSRGNFVAKLSTSYSFVTHNLGTQTATVPVKPVTGVDAGPLVTVAAVPGTKSAPHRVDFSLATTDSSEVQSWQLLFGDGKSESGKGKPPASITHTYARTGTFRARIVLTEEHGGELAHASFPAGGIPVSVGLPH